MCSGPSVSFFFFCWESVISLYFVSQKAIFKVMNYFRCPENLVKSLHSTKKFKICLNPTSTTTCDSKKHVHLLCLIADEQSCLGRKVVRKVIKEEIVWDKFSHFSETEITSSSVHVTGPSQTVRKRKKF